MSTSESGFEGGCVCGAVRYRMNRRPMFVHCCHCTWCQRETGTAFALNALIEASEVDVLGEAPELVHTPSASGKGQKIARCPTCRVAVWSHYGGGGNLISFVRVGTLDDSTAFPPDIHIYTSTKLPWVALPPDVPAMPEYYRSREQWPAESLERARALRRAE